MEKRRLGGSSLEIAPLVLGGNVFGWTVDEPTAFRILDAFVDAGFNCIDTADYYSRFVPGNRGGESETMIGNWLAQGGRRARVVIATKLGSDMGDGKQGLSRAYMRRAVEASLKRLKTDHIDLYQSHWDDESVAVEEVLAGYDELINAGKVRAIGASNFTAARFGEALDCAEANGLPRYESLQPGYNLYDRAEFEGEIEALCLRRGVGVIPYYGLASGFLTGKYRSEADLQGSVRADRARKYLNPRGHAILAALDTVAADLHATVAQVALAWLMQRPAITAPIASATSVAQLEELTKAAALRLSAAHVAALDAASAEQSG